MKPERQEGARGERRRPICDSSRHSGTSESLNGEQTGEGRTVRKLGQPPGDWVAGEKAQTQEGVLGVCM